MSEFAAFGRLIDALRPWLGQVVIVGGWAHRLHRFHPLSHPPAYSPLRTRDADVAFSLSATLTGDIAAALQSAGFERDFSGDDTPPVTHYRLSGNDQGFYAEFLAPLLGGDSKRDGRPDVTFSRAGVTAQKLRHLDMLLVRPWTVRLSAEIGVPLQSPTDVLLANPVSFIAQKLLIQKYRKPEKKAQDALYIHDTLELFGGELPAMKALWQQIRPELHDKTATAVASLQRDHYAVVTDVLRNAARIPQDRIVTAERMQATIAYGLGEIFG